MRGGWLDSSTGQACANGNAQRQQSGAGGSFRTANEELGEDGWELGGVSQSCKGVVDVVRTGVSTSDCWGRRFMQSGRQDHVVGLAEWAVGHGQTLADGLY